MKQFTVLVLAASVFAHSICFAAPSREAMFKWFDAATSSAVGGSTYIEYYPGGSKYPYQYKVKGFILKETADNYQIRLTSLRVGWYTKQSAPGLPPPSHDLGRAITDVEKDFDVNMQSLDGADIHAEFYLFVLARFAALIGQDQLSEGAWRASYSAADRIGRFRKRSYQLVIRDETEERHFQSLLWDDLTDLSVPREEVSARFRKFGREFSKGRYGPKALQLAQELEAPSSLVEIEFMSLPTDKRELALPLLRELREFTAGNPSDVGFGYPEAEPWKARGDTYDPHAKYWGPIPQISRLGTAAIDALMDAIYCDDLTRVPSGDPDHPIMTVGDLCERLLEKMAHRIFLDHDVSATPCQDRRYAMIARQRADQWRTAFLITQMMSGLK